MRLLLNVSTNHKALPSNTYAKPDSSKKSVNLLLRLQSHLRALTQNRSFQRCSSQPISWSVLLHPFNGFFSRTTWVSWYQKGRAILDFNEARDDGWQWHQLHHVQIICTLLQRDNHTSTSSLNFLLPTNNVKALKAAMLDLVFAILDKRLASIVKNKSNTAKATI